MLRANRVTALDTTFNAYSVNDMPLVDLYTPASLNLYNCTFNNPGTGIPNAVSAQQASVVPATVGLLIIMCTFNGANINLEVGAAYRISGVILIDQSLRAIPSVIPQITRR